jgi:hypothetical protein
VISFLRRLYKFLISPVHAICPAHPILLSVIAVFDQNWPINYEAFHFARDLRFSRQCECETRSSGTQSSLAVVTNVLRNTGNHLQDHTVSQLTRPQSTSLSGPCNFIHYPIISSLLSPNILLGTFLTDTFIHTIL